MEVGQGPNWGCSAKEKKLNKVASNSGTCIPRTWFLDGGNKSRRQNLDRETSCKVDSKGF
jgi:hypothetical protein